MILKFRGIGNDKITVVYNEVMKCVAVMDLFNKRENVFAGYPLEHLFNEFHASFSENITFDDACKHFTPNITSLKV